jgi:hypothetical protein
MTEDREEPIPFPIPTGVPVMQQREIRRVGSILLGVATLMSSMIAADVQAATVATCSSDFSGQVMSANVSQLESYACGVPSAGLGQAGPEDIYEFTCQGSGPVTVQLSGLDCDLDLYILDGTCDPGAGCLEGATTSSTTNESVTFSCTAGITYAIVIEGLGFDAAACTPSQGNYTVDFEVGPANGCEEDCDNGLDDDFDGDTDCDDSACFTAEECGGPSPVEAEICAPPPPPSVPSIARPWGFWVLLVLVTGVALLVSPRRRGHT